MSGQTFGDALFDFGKSASTLVLDSAIAAHPELGIAAAIFGYETEDAKEKREAREFAKRQRNHQVKLMKDYDEDRAFKLKQRSDYEEDRLRRLEMQNLSKQSLQQNLAIGQLNEERVRLGLKAQHGAEIQKFSHGQMESALVGARETLSKEISAFQDFTLEQKKQLYNSSTANEYAKYIAVVDGLRSGNETKKEVSLNIAKQLGMNISSDGKTLTLPNGKTLPFDEQTSRFLSQDMKRQLADEAIAIYRRDKWNNYIDGYARNQVVSRLQNAMRTSENDSAGTLAMAQKTFLNSYGNFSEMHRQDFEFSSGVLYCLSDGKLDAKELQQYGPQLEYWAKLNGINYSVSQDGQFTIKKPDGSSIDAKEYFTEQLNKNPISKYYNDLEKQLTEQKNKRVQQSNLEVERQDSYERNFNRLNLGANTELDKKQIETLLNINHEAEKYFQYYKGQIPEDDPNYSNKLKSLIVQMDDFYNDRVKNAGFDSSIYSSPFILKRLEIEKENVAKSLDSLSKEVIKTYQDTQKPENKLPSMKTWGERLFAPHIVARTGGVSPADIKHNRTAKKFKKYQQKHKEIDERYQKALKDEERVKVLSSKNKKGSK